ncbi:unnamed protein product, partial [Mesorhabditis spiculigera]
MEPQDDGFVSGGPTPRDPPVDFPPDFQRDAASSPPRREKEIVTSTPYVDSKVSTNRAALDRHFGRRPRVDSGQWLRPGTSSTDSESTSSISSRYSTAATSLCSIDDEFIETFHAKPTAAEADMSRVLDNVSGALNEFRRTENQRREKQELEAINKKLRNENQRLNETLNQTLKMNESRVEEKAETSEERYARLEQELRLILEQMQELKEVAGADVFVHAEGTVIRRLGEDKEIQVESEMPLPKTPPPALVDRPEYDQLSHHLEQLTRAREEDAMLLAKLAAERDQALYNAEQINELKIAIEEQYQQLTESAEKLVTEQKIDRQHIRQLQQAYTQEKNKAEGKLKSAEAEIVALQENKKLADEQVTATTIELDALRQRSGLLETRISELETEIEKAGTDAGDRVSRASFEAQSKQFHQICGQLRMEEENVEALRKELVSLKQKLIESEERNERLLEEMSSEQIKAEAALNERDRTERQLKNVEEEKAALEKRVLEVKQAKSSSYQREINMIAEERDGYKRDVEKLTKEVDFLRMKVSKAATETTTKEAVDQLKAVTEERDEARLRCDRLEKSTHDHFTTVREMAELKGQMTVAERQVQAKDNELRDQGARLLETQKQVEEFRYAYQEQQLKNASLEAEIQRIEHECQQFIEQIAELRQEHLEHDHNATIADLLTDPMRQLIEQLKTARDEVRQTVDALLRTRLTATDPPPNQPVAQAQPPVVHDVVTEKIRELYQRLAEQEKEQTSGVPVAAARALRNLLHALLQELNNTTAENMASDFLNSVGDAHARAMDSVAKALADAEVAYAQCSEQLNILEDKYTTDCETYRARCKQTEAHNNTLNERYQKLEQQMALLTRAHNPEAQKQLAEALRQIENLRGQVFRAEKGLQEACQDIEEADREQNVQLKEMQRLITEMGHIRDELKARDEDLVREKYHSKEQVEKYKLRLENEQKQHNATATQLLSVEAALAKEKELHELDKHTNFESVKLIIRGNSFYKQLLANNKAKYSELLVGMRALVSRINECGAQCDPEPKNPGAIEVQLREMQQHYGAMITKAEDQQRKEDEDVERTMAEDENAITYIEKTLKVQHSRRPPGKASRTVLTRSNK